MSYKFIESSLKKAYFISEIKPLLDNDQIQFYVPDDIDENGKLNRKVFDGILTLIVKINSVKIGICYNDFRGFGSTFGIENSKRLAGFIDELSVLKLPLIYLANSSGIRIQDSRSVFRNSFTLIQKIKTFSSTNLYISACLGQSLGLSALLYSLADYRIGLARKNKFNLTGPEIFKMFFGDKVNFEETCDAETMLYENQLVQEICQNKDEMFSRIRELFSSQDSSQKEADLKKLVDLKPWLEQDSLELFCSMGKSIHLYVKETKKMRVMFFLNPLGKPNMMGVLDLKKYRYGLQLAKKLKLPIIFLVDTAGADPRISENNKNIARTLYDLASDIIDYPFYKRSLVIGRCFGGASILSIPVFFGGDKTLLIEETKIGIMDNNIIKHVLTGAKPLLEKWEDKKLSEPSDYRDFVEDGLSYEVTSFQVAFQRLLKELV